MKALKNISLLALAILMISSSVMARTSLKRHNRIHLRNAHIGFYQGATLLDVSKGSNTPTGRKYITAATTGMSFGFPIINQFRAEVGLSMNNIMMNPNNNPGNILLKKSSYVSVPVSVQYYLLPKKSKIQPYFGIGAMVVPDAQKYLFIKSGDGIKALKGNNTVDLFITQGVNIELNTHIHLTESLHIISSEGKTNYGINFGVNLYIP